MSRLTPPGRAAFGVSGHSRSLLERADWLAVDRARFVGVEAVSVTHEALVAACLGDLGCGQDERDGEDGDSGETQQVLHEWLLEGWTE
jgi:hypothetical protein